MKLGLQEQGPFEAFDEFLIRQRREELDKVRFA